MEQVKAECKNKIKFWPIIQICRKGDVCDVSHARTVIPHPSISEPVVDIISWEAFRCGTVFFL